MISKLFGIGLDTLKPRERVALAVGGLAILLAVLQFFVIEPLDRKTEFLKRQVSSRKADLRWMRQAAEKIIRLRESDTAREEVAHSQSLLIVVDNSAKKAGISRDVKRIEPASQESVRVWIEEVAFDNLVRWLGELRAAGVYSDNIAIERRKVSGRVNAKATLRWLP
uniref:Type II secretion system protein M n=1 Tax=Candidatus Kentrum sp. TC TaxID=2126339 RepID=A0A450ZTP7_9GAMM|nr:MAG: Type II secretory pathway, component PulM [Candidatus Kentron sp. TC]VFK57170.1 MAG: Type II secretory pathway, component PulM [Candidatus Kentron sp. TC]